MEKELDMAETVMTEPLKIARKEERAGRRVCEKKA